MRKILAAKKIVSVIFKLFFIVYLSSPVKAGVPVVNLPSLTQQITIAFESVTQTLQQIEEYRTQLSQYENQILNTLNPDTWVWDDAVTTMDNVRGAVDTIKSYKTTLGSLDAYLDKFKDLNAYKANPCFTRAGCSDAEFNELLDSRALASESQKKANDALFKGLDMQQDALQTDARQLEKLQRAAHTVTGQVQAIQFTNQLASNQANQLLHIRSLLIAQQNASTTMQQAKVNKEAQEEASSQHLRSKFYSPSPNINW